MKRDTNGSNAVEKARSSQVQEYETNGMVEEDFNPSEVVADNYTPTPTETEDDMEDSTSVDNTTEIDDNQVDDGQKGGDTTVATEMEDVPGADPSILDMDREKECLSLDESQLLDASFADIDNTMLLQQPELVKRAAEVVIGRDDRIRINATTGYPWRCICSLLVTAADGSRWIGTGFLVGPRLVVTAGHVVYMHNRGGWARRIEVIPGRNGTSRPYGSCFSSLYHSVNGWTKKKKRNYDYAAIVLPSNCKYGNRLGYFGYAAYGNSGLQNTTVNVAGYPGDKPPGTHWWHARKLTAIRSKTLVYNIDTAGGQSGAPVWQYKNGVRHVVGIHTNGSTSGNSATRITREVFDNIKRWKNKYR